MQYLHFQLRNGVAQNTVQQDRVSYVPVFKVTRYKQYPAYTTKQTAVKCFTVIKASNVCTEFLY